MPWGFPDHSLASPEGWKSERKRFVFVRVLSLPHDSEKRRAIGRDLLAAGVEFAFVDGVDGRAMNIQRDSNSPLTSPEAACSFGHLKIYEESLQAGQEWTLVLEDDVSLAADFSYVLNQVEVGWLPSFPGKPAIVLLGGQEGLAAHIYFVGVTCGFFGRHRLLRSFRSEKFAFRTCGYLINREAARRILAINRGLVFRADEWTAYMSKGALEELYLLKPGIVMHPRELAASAIQSQRSTTRHSKGFPDRTRAALMVIARLLRFIYLSILASFQ